MDKPFVIGLTGQAFSGKDTAYHFAREYIVHEAGIPQSDVMRASFAESLKKACMECFSLAEYQVYNETEKEVEDERWKMTPRQIMQKVGSALRSVDKDVFIKNVKCQIDKAKPQIVFITDVRFDNEAEFVVEQLGGVVIKISRPNGTKTKDGAHESEQGISEKYIYMTIENDGTLMEFGDKVRHEISKVFSNL